MTAREIKQYFINHPEVDNFHFTSDGAAFFNDNDAWGNAQRLTDKLITQFNRSEVMEWDDDTEVKLTSPDVIPTIIEDFTVNPTVSITRIVTEEDLTNMPALAEQGIGVGDELTVMFKLIKKAEPTTPPSSEPAAPKYSDMKNDDLIAEINKRGLELGTASKKADYVAILEADDSSKTNQ